MIACPSFLRKLSFPALFILILTIFFFSPPSVYAYELIIGTGSQGSFSQLAGKAVCRALERFDRDYVCRTVPAENNTDSLTNLLAGSLDLALVDSKMIYDAFHGTGSFQYIAFDYDQLRHLMPLYRMPVCLVVRSDANIKSFADLATKRVNGGAAFSLQNIVFREILAAEGMSRKDFALFQNLSSANAQDFLALKGGSVQAMLHVGMHPDQRLERGLNQGRIEIVGVSGQAVSRLIDSSAGYYRQTIMADTYPEISSDIDTLSLETLLITSADTDDETATRILEAIYAARKQLQLTHPAFLQEKTDVETLNAGYLHPHPAAILFFQANQNRL